MSTTGRERPEMDREQLELIGNVVERYRMHWPLSPRQVYYAVVEQGGAGLWTDERMSFLGTLRAGLIEGRLPLAAVAEGGEELREGGAWEDAEEFVHSEIESFLWGYRRDLLQGQEHHVEVWVEKAGVMDMVGEVAVAYCVTTVCCAGFPSVGFMQSVRTRLAEARERSQSPVILFFGDYVPGEGGTLSRLQETLRTDGNLWEIAFRAEAVTAEDVVKYNLPESVETRSRKRHGGAEPGSVPVELEALPPDVLAERVRASIESSLDMALVNNQRAVQAREALRLGKLRAGIMRRVRSILREQMPRAEG